MKKILNIAFISSLLIRRYFLYVVYNNIHGQLLQFVWRLEIQWCSPKEAYELYRAPTWR